MHPKYETLYAFAQGVRAGVSYVPTQPAMNAEGCAVVDAALEEWLEQLREEGAEDVPTLEFSRTFNASIEANLWVEFDLFNTGANKNYISAWAKELEPEILHRRNLVDIATAAPAALLWLDQIVDSILFTANALKRADLKIDPQEWITTRRK